MGFRESYDSRFYRVSKIFAVFIVIIAFISSYNNRIKLSESIMITIICVLLLFIQECINKIQKNYKWGRSMEVKRFYKEYRRKGF